MYKTLSNLHSTMFSINRIVSQLIVWYCCNLHSTMFSINHQRRETIPAGSQNLHSTMFSINPSPCKEAVSWGIYLHSTMFSINLRHGQVSILCNLIYIPLCFLLIWIIWLIVIAAILFTFHYVFY